MLNFSRALKNTAFTLTAVVGLNAVVTTPAVANSYYNCTVEGADAATCHHAKYRYDWEKDYTKTKNPIVLVHGFAGWTSAIGIDYFYDIGSTLMLSGTDTIFAPLMSSLNSSEIRAEQLLQQVETMQAVSGKKTFNFIAHSQGGPTVRIVHSARPEIFASLTTMAGAHGGTKVADDVLKARFENDYAKIPMMAVEKIFDFLGSVLGFASSGDVIEQNIIDALYSLQPSKMVAFNAKHPAGMPTEACGEGDYEDANGVKFYSFAGNRVATNNLDPLEWFFHLTSLSFKPTNEVNDGLVKPCDAHFGKVIRDDYPLNHIDMVNGIIGIRDHTVVDPREIYSMHVNRLKEAGL